MTDEQVYFIEYSARFNSTFSGNSWSEGNMVFVKGIDNFDKANYIISDMMTQETKDHVVQIRGSAWTTCIAGTLKGTHSFEDIKDCTSIDIFYNDTDGNLLSKECADTVVDTIESYPILNDVSKLKVWVALGLESELESEVFTDGQKYLPNYTI